MTTQAFRNDNEEKQIRDEENHINQDHHLLYS